METEMEMEMEMVKQMGNLLPQLIMVKNQHPSTPKIVNFQNFIKY